MRLSTSISILLTVFNLAFAQGQVIDTLCVGNTIGNYGVAYIQGSTYYWESEGGTLLSPNGYNTITVKWKDVPGTYKIKVHVVTAYGCPGDTVISLVWVREGPRVTIVGPDVVCEGQPVLLIAYGADKYVWSTGDTTAAIYVTPSVSTDYTVYGINGCGVDSALKRITVVTNPVANFTFTPNNPFVNENVYFTFTGSDATQFEWYLDYYHMFSTSANPIYSFSTGGRKFVTLIAMNNYGCTDSISKYIDVMAENIVHVPNAFTPNGDGINDYFFAKGINITEFTMYIYDRWGGQIFETNSIYQGWDGTYEDLPCQQGVYPWIIYYKGEGGSPQYLTGHVTLIR